MNITLAGVVFTVALFGCLALLASFTRKRVIDKPMDEARARGAATADFVDDLMRNRWVVIIGLGVLVFLDKQWRVTGGLLQSRWVLIGLVTVIFVGRTVMRRKG